MLINPNAAMEWMWSSTLVQEGIYARFIDRVVEIGAFGEIEAIREGLNADQQELMAKNAGSG